MLVEEEVINVYRKVYSGTLGRFPNRFWDDVDGREKAKICVRYLCFKILEITDRDFICIVDTQNLSKYKLNGMYNKVYKMNYLGWYDLIQDAFPDKFKPWELKQVGAKYWTDTTITDAIKWLFTKKYAYSDDFIRKNYSEKFLIDNGLKTLTNQGYSLYQIIDMTFPNKFKPWEFSSVPDNYWTESEAKDAIQWLYTKKYKFSKEFILNNHSRRFLKDNHLITLANRYGLLELLELAFPNEFKTWELQRICNNYWTEDAIRECFDTLFMSEGKLDKDKVYSEFSTDFLRKHHILSMTSRTKNTVFELLEMAYPGEFRYEKWVGLKTTRR